MPASRRDAAVIAALTDVVTRYPRWGFWKLFDRMRVEGRRWNHKHVHRVYCALRLNLPRRTTRRVPQRMRQPLAAPPRLKVWALVVFPRRDRGAQLMTISNAAVTSQKSRGPDSILENAVIGQDWARDLEATAAA